MSHYATDFGMEIDYAVPSPSCLGQQFKRPPIMDEFMELLRQNGQVVTQSLTQRCKSSSPCKLDHDPLTESFSEQHQSLYIQEDDMVSSCPWLQYPITSTDFDDNEQFCSDFLYPPSFSTVTTPIQGINSPQTLPQLLENPKINSASARESSSVVDSNNTPAISSSVVRATVGFSNKDYEHRSISGTPGITETATAANNNELRTCDLTASSNEESTFSDQILPVSPPQETAAVDKPPQAATSNRKRKSTSRISNAGFIHVDETETEYGNTKKTAQKSTSKKPRAAEVHNESERRRRDRINEKMRALQELIPRCNKSDKASMLDEAIEYLKSLQLQVQMMSMGCGMIPMMFPAMQQYMGMGFGMDLGINRPIGPFANLNPRFPLPAFHVPAHDPSRERTAVPDPFYPYLAGHPLVQNPVRPGCTDASTGRHFGNCEKKQ